MSTKKNDERRSFLKRSLGLAGSAALAMSLPVLSGCEEETFKATAPTGPQINDNKMVLDLTSSEYESLATVGNIVDLDVQHQGETLKLMVYRASASDIVTMTRICTHQGCDLALKFSGFITETDLIQCACHSSRFDLTNGDVVRGPASENLKTYLTTIEGNLVTITIA